MHGGGFLLELLPFSGPKRQGAKASDLRPEYTAGFAGDHPLRGASADLDVAIEKTESGGRNDAGEPVTIARGAVNIAYFDEQADHGLHYIRNLRESLGGQRCFLDPDGVVVELVERIRPRDTQTWRPYWRRLHRAMHILSETPRDPVAARRGTGSKPEPITEVARMSAGQIGTLARTPNGDDDGGRGLPVR